MSFVCSDQETVSITAFFKQMNPYLSEIGNVVEIDTFVDMMI